MRDLIKEHFSRYPRLTPRDLFKLIYQSAYGCEHFLSDRRSAELRIRNEYDSKRDTTPRQLENIGDYCRVGLSYLNRGLSPATLAALFCLSAVPDPRGKEKLSEGITALTALVESGEAAIERENFFTELSHWQEAGFPAISHSDSFRQEYSPSYRVISKRYAPFLPILARIDRLLESGEVRLAIEGGSASGKSSFGALLEEIYGCTLFHMDDFFLPAEMRSAERLGEPGGNVHRERFLEEVLLPLSRGEEIAYHRFDCSTSTLIPPIIKKPTRLTVTEGAYSTHPELRSFYNLTLFLDISPERQRERILKRNTPETAERHFSLWIPMEERYFSAFEVKKSCDEVISIV